MNAGEVYSAVEFVVLFVCTCFSAKSVFVVSVLKVALAAEKTERKGKKEFPTPGLEPGSRG